MFDPYKTLGLQKTFNIDLNVLEQAYFAAQRNTHPDRFTLADEQKKKESSRQATLVNQAYALLKNPLDRATYLLEVRGVSLLTHDPEFLPKVIEWHERTEAGEDLTSELVCEEAALLQELTQALEHHQDELATKALYRLNYVQKVKK
ncbi:MAG: DnaJ domain-containing protein [Alphaproteobacteria bacterium]|nr:DnaJ domain-containing protein [Alphaproteobacteria bacterium]